MSESGYYPPGAEHDPRAPYNEPEPVECPDCAGRGFVVPPEAGVIHETPHGTVVMPSLVKCGNCDGEGTIDRREIEDEGPDPDDLRDREFDRQMNDD